MDFTATIPKLRDFFKVDVYSNGLHVKIHLTFLMPGMTEQELQKSIKNTLQHANLWLNNKTIETWRPSDMGFLEKSNSEYTYTHKITTDVVQAITKEAETNPAAAEQLALIKGENFIWCVSKKIYGKKVVGNGIAIQITINNYKPVYKLIKMLPSSAISTYYIIRFKAMKLALKPETYNKLIT